MIVHEQREEFDDRNLVLQATLGALSIGARFDAILDRHAPERTVAPAEPCEVDEFLAALLGAISVRLTIGRVADGVESDTPPKEPASPDRPTNQYGWLR